MAEDNEQDTFTFVDKRRTSVEPEMTDDAPEQLRAAPELVDLDDDTLEPGTGEFDTGEPDTGEGEGDSLGSYGLAAYVTGLIASDAWQKMGLIADPSTGGVNRDLPQAKFSIDCVAAIVGLLEQRPSAVPAQLRSDLQRVLNDLRLNFIEQSRR
jgi:hypothetical protein